MCIKSLLTVTVFWRENLHATAEIFSWNKGQLVSIWFFEVVDFLQQMFFGGNCWPLATASFPCHIYSESNVYFYMVAFAYLVLTDFVSLEWTSKYNPDKKTI